MNVFLHKSEFMKACMDVSKKCIKYFPPIFRYIFGDYLLNLQETNWVHMVDF